MKDNVSLIITTYNNPDYLKLSLRSAWCQTRLPDEILIADDGSTSETADLIESFRRQSHVPLRHVWQEDDGFRRTVIVNKAMAAASGQYLIVIDADIVLHPRFIEDHMRIARAGCFYSGSRMLVSEKMTHRLLSAGAEVYMPLWVRWKEINAYRIPSIFFCVSKRYKRKQRYRGMRGGLMGAWKQDIVAVNGYDERFRGWGCEDAELGERLKESGLTMLNLKFGAIAYHLWHPTSSRSAAQENEQRHQDTIRLHLTWSDDGMDKHLNTTK